MCKTTKLICGGCLCLLIASVVTVMVSRSQLGQELQQATGAEVGRDNIAFGRPDGDKPRFNYSR